MHQRLDSVISEMNFSLTEHIQSLVVNSVRSFLAHCVPQLYVMRIKENKILSFLVLFFTIPLASCGSLTRNDLIADPINTIHGKLLVRFSEQNGFEKGIREASIYHLSIQFVEIRESSDGKTVSVEIRLYDESEKLAYESPRFSGEISRRLKYNDWLVGREEDIRLNLSDYEIVVTLSHPIDQTETPEVLVYTKKLKGKRLEKSGWLDLF